MGAACGARDKYEVWSCPVLSCPVQQDDQDHHYHHDDHDNGDHGNHEEVGSYMSKLEVVHKEAGGCTQGSWRLSLNCSN